MTLPEALRDVQVKGAALAVAANAYNAAVDVAEAALAGTKVLPPATWASLTGSWSESLLSWGQA